MDAGLLADLARLIGKLPVLLRKQGLSRARLGCRAGPRRRLQEPSFEDPRRHAALGLLVCGIAPASRSLKPPGPFAASSTRRPTGLRPVRPARYLAPERPLRLSPRLPLRERDFGRDRPMLALRSGVACNGFLRGSPFPAWYLTGSGHARLAPHAKRPRCSPTRVSPLAKERDRPGPTRQHCPGALEPLPRPEQVKSPVWILLCTRGGQPDAGRVRRTDGNPPPRVGCGESWWRVPVTARARC